MKKTLLLTLLITLLIPQISMAKLSKREAAAKKAGGTLNYKTGKISTPVKTTRSTASKSVSPLVGAGPLLPGQSRVG